MTRVGAKSCRGRTLLFLPSCLAGICGVRDCSFVGCAVSRVPGGEPFWRKCFFGAAGQGRVSRLEVKGGALNGAHWRTSRAYLIRRQKPKITTQSSPCLTQTLMPIDGPTHVCGERAEHRFDTPDGLGRICGSNYKTGLRVDHLPLITVPMRNPTRPFFSCASAVVAYACLDGT